VAILRLAFYFSNFRLQEFSSTAEKKRRNQILNNSGEDILYRLYLNEFGKIFWNNHQFPKWLATKVTKIGRSSSR
jgi:hypothetical protein